MHLQLFEKQVLQPRWFWTIIFTCSRRLWTGCLWWKTIRIQEGTEYYNHQWKLDHIIAIKILMEGDQCRTISETSALVGVNVWTVHTILSELMNMSKLLSLQDGFLDYHQKMISSSEYIIVIGNLYLNHQIKLPG